MRQWTVSSLVQLMACCLLGDKPLPKPMLAYWQLDSWKEFLGKSKQNSFIFFQENALEYFVCQIVDHLLMLLQNPWKRKSIWKSSQQNRFHTVLNVQNACYIFFRFPDNKVHGANMGPTWVLSALDGPHVGAMTLLSGLCFRQHELQYYRAVYILPTLFTYNDITPQLAL